MRIYQERKQYFEDYYSKNKEKIHNYYLLNKEKIIGKSKSRRIENRERYNEYFRQYIKKWRLNNFEKDRDYHNQWRKENKEKVNIWNNNYRVRKFNAEGSFTYNDWIEIKKKTDFRCVYCKRQEPEISLAKDHIIPLSKGGTNKKENIQPLCKDCNSRKGNRYDEELKIVSIN